MKFTIQKQIKKDNGNHHTTPQMEHSSIYARGSTKFELPSEKIDTETIEREVLCDMWRVHLQPFQKAQDPTLPLPSGL